MNRIYLDHNATTPVDPEVFDAMRPYFCDRFGNASSLHSHGQESRRAVDAARRQVATLIGATPSEVVFVSGGTEADNLALTGVVAEFRRRQPNVVPHVIVSTVEHPAVLDCAENAREEGVALSIIPVDANGRVDPEDVVRALRENTCLVSVMLANNEVGTIGPVREIAALVKARSAARIHTDAVQCAGKVSFSVADLGVDLLSISAHKIYGPKGVGALFVRQGASLQPQLHGGGQELRRRPGTENVPGIIGFGRACELARSRLPRYAAATSALRNLLKKRLLEAIPDVLINGSPEGGLPNTLNVSFLGTDAPAVLANLDLAGISASGGSACATGRVDPPRVLLAMGRSPGEASGAVRFSLGEENSESDIDRTVLALKDIVARLRDVSKGQGASESTRFGRSTTRDLLPDESR